jgi:hypothetical protein
MSIHDVLDEAGLARSDVASLLATVRDLVRAEVDAVAAAGTQAIPVTDLDGFGDEATRALVRRRGCVVVRGTFERAQAVEWDRELGDYLAGNAFDERFAAQYPEAAVNGSRICGIYWSRPQVEARQHDRMDAVRRALNSLWRHRTGNTEWFDPDHDIGYPDRIRRRAPGVVARGLAPHIDSPACGGWLVPENRAVFAEVLAGRPEAYDPFDAAHRTSLDVVSPVGCSVFRTFQGWTALSETRPEDGGLSIVPVPSSAAYLLVASIARELGGPAEPAPARVGNDPLFAPALVSMPTVYPGDTVWWHGDLVHAVADATNDTRWSNVMYIGSSPRCPRNDAYAATMFERFVSGRSPVDFPPDDFETTMVGRPTPDDLNARGRRQFAVSGAVRAASTGSKVVHGA